MAATASGFWYPDGTTPYNVKAMLTTAASAQESALQTTKIHNGHINYATAGARDTAFTAAGGAVIGDQCSVAGQPQWYNGTIWQTTFAVAAYGGLQRTANVTLTQGTWLDFNQSSGYGSTKNVTVNAIAGITILIAGRYVVEGNWSFSNSVSGTVPALAGGFYKNGAATGSTIVCPRNISGTTAFSNTAALDLDVGDIIRQAATTSSGSTGATATLTGARFTVNRIPD